MSFCCNKVHKTSFAQNKNGSPVIKFVFIKIWSYSLDFFCMRFQTCYIKFMVKMPCVADHRIMFHAQKMFYTNDMPVSRHSNEQISEFGSLSHRHNTITFHNSLKSFQRVNFRYNNISAESSCSHGTSLTAPAITDHYDSFS